MYVAQIRIKKKKNTIMSFDFQYFIDGASKFVHSKYVTYYAAIKYSSLMNDEMFDKFITKVMDFLYLYKLETINIVMADKETVDEIIKGIEEHLALDTD